MIDGYINKSSPLLFIYPSILSRWFSRAWWPSRFTSVVWWEKGSVNSVAIFYMNYPSLDPYMVPVSWWWRCTNIPTFSGKRKLVVGCWHVFLSRWCCFFPFLKVGYLTVFLEGVCAVLIHTLYNLFHVAQFVVHQCLYSREGHMTQLAKGAFFFPLPLLPGNWITWNL